MVRKSRVVLYSTSLSTSSKRTSIVVTGIDDQWSMDDLADMTKYAKYNDRNKYILVVVDVLSKFVWLRNVRDKIGESVALALTNILKGHRKPNRTTSDMGQ